MDLLICLGLFVCLFVWLFYLIMLVVIIVVYLFRDVWIQQYCCGSYDGQYVVDDGGGCYVKVIMLRLKNMFRSSYVCVLMQLVKVMNKL